MPITEPAAPSNRAAATRTIFWAAVWLALVLVGLKAFYLGAPGAPAVSVGQGYLRSLAAISYGDVLFAAFFWFCGRTALLLAGSRPAVTRIASFAVVSLAALSCLYAILNILIFGTFGGFLTYPLLLLIGNVRMLSSSVAAYVTWRNVLGLVVLPVAYIGLVCVTLSLKVRDRRTWWSGRGVALAALVGWVLFGQYTYANEWATRQQRRVAENPHWVLASSWWQAVSGDGIARMTEGFTETDLSDFNAIGTKPPVPLAVGLRRTRAQGQQARAARARRPPNVILIVLESVAARWTGLNGQYDTTPRLKAESARGLVFENIYAHIGRSSNSLAAMLLSTYPRLSFREATEEDPHLAATSLPALFRKHGYQTAFFTPSDLSWAGWDTYLAGRGFEELRDYHSLPCTEMVSSWGVEDRCMIEGIIDVVRRAPARPFFLMGWTTQTHHPYEPTPGVSLLSLLKERTPDDWDLWRYLNVLHETDRHLGRLFEAVRRAGLDNDTLIVITGDHGQAFGYPHDSYFQGKTVYQEDVHVPLMIWSPRVYRSAARSKTIGSHVDLAPTIAELAGLPAVPEWQGRSLFDATRAPRAYFYVAEDHFTLVVREGNWKYIFDLREGTEELYDLEHDPTEQHNLVKAFPERASRLRGRLAAWTEANRRQYERPLQAASLAGPN